MSDLETPPIAKTVEIHPDQGDGTRRRENCHQMRVNEYFRADSRDGIKGIGREKQKQVQQKELNYHICAGAACDKIIE